MKAFAEIAKTASVVQKENTLIDIKIKLNLPSLIPALIYIECDSVLRLPVTTKTPK